MQEVSGWNLDGICKYLPHLSLSYVIIMCLIAVSVCINCIGLPIHCNYHVATLAIIAVSLEYLRQFLIDLHQSYRHSSVP